jgi:hypothetical protein
MVAPYARCAQQITAVRQGADGQSTAPNHGMQATAYSVRSCAAPVPAPLAMAQMRWRQGINGRLRKQCVAVQCWRVSSDGQRFSQNGTAVHSAEDLPALARRLPQRL